MAASHTSPLPGSAAQTLPRHNSRRSVRSTTSGGSGISELTLDSEGEEARYNSDSFSSVSSSLSNLTIDHSDLKEVSEGHYTDEEALFKYVEDEDEDFEDGFDLDLSSGQVRRLVGASDDLDLDDLQWTSEDTGFAVTSTPNISKTPPSSRTPMVPNTLEDSDDEDWNRDLGIEPAGGVSLSGLLDDDQEQQEAVDVDRVPASHLLDLADSPRARGPIGPPAEAYSVTGPDGTSTRLFEDAGAEAAWLCQAVRRELEASGHKAYVGLSPDSAFTMAQARLAGLQTEQHTVAWAQAYVAYTRRVLASVDVTTAEQETATFIDLMARGTYASPSVRRSVAVLGLATLGMALRQASSQATSSALAATLLKMQPDLQLAVDLHLWEARAHWALSAGGPVAVGELLPGLQDLLGRAQGAEGTGGAWGPDDVLAAGLADLHVLLQGASPLTYEPVPDPGPQWADSVGSSVPWELAANAGLRMDQTLLPLYLRLPGGPAKHRAAVALAQHRWDAGDVAEAHGLLLDALWLLAKEATLLGPVGARALQLCGELLQGCSLHGPALTTLEAALQAATMASCPNTALSLRRKLAVLGQRVDWRRAVQYHAQVLEDMQASGRTNEAIHVALQLSAILADHGEHATAESFLQRTLATVLRDTAAPDDKRGRTDPLVLGLRQRLAQVYVQGQRADRGLGLLEDMLQAGPPVARRFGLQCTMVDALLRRRWLAEAQDVLAACVQQKGAHRHLVANGNSSGAVGEASTSRVQFENNRDKARLPLGSAPQLAASFKMCYLQARTARMAQRHASALHYCDEAVRCSEGAISSQALAYRMKGKVFRQLARSSTCIDLPLVLDDQPIDGMPGTPVPAGRTYGCTHELVGAAVRYLGRAHELFVRANDEVRACKVLADMASVQLQRLMAPVALGLPLQALPAHQDALHNIEGPAIRGLELAVEGCLLLGLLQGYANMAELRHLQGHTPQAMAYWAEARDLLYGTLVPGGSVPVTGAWSPAVVEKLLEIVGRLVLLLLCWDAATVNANLLLLDVHLGLQQAASMWPKQRPEEPALAAPPSLAAMSPPASRQEDGPGHDVKGPSSSLPANPLGQLWSLAPPSSEPPKSRTLLVPGLATTLGRTASEGNLPNMGTGISPGSTMRSLRKLDHLFAASEPSRLGGGASSVDPQAAEGPGVDPVAGRGVGGRMWAYLCRMRMRAQLCGRGEIDLVALRQHNHEVMHKLRGLVSQARQEAGSGFGAFYSPATEQGPAMDTIDACQHHGPGTRAGPGHNVDGWRVREVGELQAQHPGLYRLLYVLLVDGMLVGYVPATAARALTRIKGRPLLEDGYAGLAGAPAEQTAYVRVVASGDRYASAVLATRAGTTLAQLLQALRVFPGGHPGIDLLAVDQHFARQMAEQCHGLDQPGADLCLAMDPVGGSAYTAIKDTTLPLQALCGASPTLGCTEDHPLVLHVYRAVQGQTVLCPQLPQAASGHGVGRARTLGAEAIGYLLGYLDDGPPPGKDPTLGPQAVQQEADRKQRALGQIRAALGELLALVPQADDGPMESEGGSSTGQMGQMSQSGIRGLFSPLAARSRADGPPQPRTTRPSVVLVGGPTEQALPWDLLMEPYHLVRAMALAPVLLRTAEGRGAAMGLGGEGPQFYSFHTGELAGAKHTRQQVQAARLQWLRTRYTQALKGTAAPLACRLAATGHPYQSLVRYGKKVAAYRRNYKHISFVDCANMGPGPNDLLMRIRRQLGAGRYAVLLLTHADLLDPGYGLLALLNEPQPGYTAVFLPRAHYKKAVRLLGKIHDRYLKGARHSTRGVNDWVLDPHRFLTEAVDKVRQEIGMSVAVFNWPPPAASQ